MDNSLSSFLFQTNIQKYMIFSPQILGSLSGSEALIQLWFYLDSPVAFYLEELGTSFLLQDFYDSYLSTYFLVIFFSHCLPMDSEQKENMYNVFDI